MICCCQSSLIFCPSCPDGCACNCLAACCEACKIKEHLHLTALFKLTFASCPTFSARSASVQTPRVIIALERKLYSACQLATKCWIARGWVPENSAVMGGLPPLLIHLTIVQWSKSNSSVHNVFISALHKKFIHSKEGWQRSGPLYVVFTVHSLPFWSNVITTLYLRGTEYLHTNGVVICGSRRHQSGSQCPFQADVSRNRVPADPWKVKSL